ncbi:MAG: DUF4202 family protein [Candidatus Woesearchaeota archaeon]
MRDVEDVVLRLCRTKETQGLNDKIDWESHIKSTVRYAKKLAARNGADPRIVELAAWLHDIDLIKGGDFKSHSKTGAREAAKILEELHYDKAMIKRVKDCISKHDLLDDLKSKEATALTDADALSHFDHFVLQAFQGYSINGFNHDKAKEWVLKKYQKSWQKLSPGQKKAVKNKYEAIRLLLH